MRDHIKRLTLEQGIVRTSARMMTLAKGLFTRNHYLTLLIIREGCNNFNAFAGGA